MLSRQLLLSLCRSDRLFFVATSKQKIFSTYRLGHTIFFFSQKQSRTIFSKNLPAPTQRMKWSLPKSVGKPSALRIAALPAGDTGNIDRVISGVPLF